MAKKKDQREEKKVSNFFDLEEILKEKRRHSKRARTGGDSGLHHQLVVENLDYIIKELRNRQ